jgi:prolipoprotein diacylglyceryltransferase
VPPWPPGAWATSSTANSSGGSPTCPGPWSSPGGRLPRHPSQLYQFALEGVSLFLILWWFSAKPRPRGLISAVFLIGYGAFRFIAEFGREPDDFLGLLTFGMSMGQWLSLPMIRRRRHGGLGGETASDRRPDRAGPGQDVQRIRLIRHYARRCSR